MSGDKATVRVAYAVNEALGAFSTANVSGVRTKRRVVVRPLSSLGPMEECVH